ncbi:MAG: hypothetical protein R3B47_05700 [Bacteroidia bacterium]
MNTLFNAYGCDGVAQWMFSPLDFRYSILSNPETNSMYYHFDGGYSDYNSLYITYKNKASSLGVQLCLHQKYLETEFKRFDNRIISSPHTETSWTGSDNIKLGAKWLQAYSEVYSSSNKPANIDANNWLQGPSGNYIKLDASAGGLEKGNHKRTN